MIIEGTVPLTTVSESFVDTADIVIAVQQFKKLHPTARIDSIDGRLVRDLCEGCGTPVFEDTFGYAYNAESDTYLCPNCTLEKQS